MAQVIANTLIGAPTTISVGPYVAAKGAGTLVEVGHTRGGVSIKQNTEHREIETDSALAPHRAVPIKRGYEVKWTMLEMTIENLLFALGQLPANKTGTPPNLTLEVNDNDGEIVHQLEIVGAGLGTLGVRTITAWRAVVKDIAEIVWQKGEERVYEVTLMLLHEETGTGNDNILKVVET